MRTLSEMAASSLIHRRVISQNNTDEGKERRAGPNRFQLSIPEPETQNQRQVLSCVLVSLDTLYTSTLPETALDGQPWPLAFSELVSSNIPAQRLADVVLGM